MAMGVGSMLNIDEMNHELNEIADVYHKFYKEQPHHLCPICGHNTPSFLVGSCHICSLRDLIKELDTGQKEVSIDSRGDIVITYEGQIQVSVRWWDGYLEEFEATETRFGCDLL